MRVDQKAYAYAWNGGESKWEQIGTVIEGPGGGDAGAGGGTGGPGELNGKQYDKIFDIEVCECVGGARCTNHSLTLLLTYAVTLPNSLSHVHTVSLSHTLTLSHAHTLSRALCLSLSHFLTLSRRFRRG